MAGDARHSVCMASGSGVSPNDDRDVATIKATACELPPITACGVCCMRQFQICVEVGQPLKLCSVLGFFPGHSPWTV